MSEAIITAIITGLLALIGVIYANRQTLAQIDKKSELSDTKLDAKLERHQAVTDTKLEELTREVRRHNDFAERIPALEEKINAANNRIEKLERRE